MDYNQSYFKKYDNDEINNNLNNYIIEKKKCSIGMDKNNNNLRLNILQSKIEELSLKLKFLNNKSIDTQKINELNKLNDVNKIANRDVKIELNEIDKMNLIGINDIITNSKLSQSNIIDNIDEIIIKLNKKIISTGQIIRKNNYVEFEF